jgi:hypothetical protein
MTNLRGPEFEFAGNIVGFFADGVVPFTAGLYHYMPYRGLGHYRMQEELDNSSHVQCRYYDNGISVSFVVLSCPEYGVLNLASFSVEPIAAG